ncbi:hypothetical protein KAI87_03910 [Myxococcota bacterium]|nr:hypothetical protein [Myxococcota bacterium]
MLFRFVMPGAGARGFMAGVILTLAIIGFVQDSFGLDAWIIMLRNCWVPLHPVFYLPFAGLGSWLLINAMEGEG